MLAMTLQTPAGPLPAEGMVAWGKAPVGQPAGQPVYHGIQFTAISWSTALALGRLLAEAPLSSGASARVS